MAYDAQLAERVRRILKGEKGLDERKMFGGLTFFINGNMCCGVQKTALMLRVGETAYAAVLARPHARVMDFTGRVMKGFVMVGSEGLGDDGALGQWVGPALEFARALPPKPPSKPRSIKKPRP